MGVSIAALTRVRLSLVSIAITGDSWAGGIGWQKPEYSRDRQDRHDFVLVYISYLNIHEGHGFYISLYVHKMSRGAGKTPEEPLNKSPCMFSRQKFPLDRVRKACNPSGLLQ